MTAPVSAFARVPAPREWPDRDPVPEVTNLDPRPADAPADPRAVVALAALGTAHGWTTRVGYSRSHKRAQRIGEYVPVETFGVWADVHPDTGFRWCAMYERRRGSGTWAWARVMVWNGERSHSDLSVTDLKEFIGVRGSVTPGWFRAITRREHAKKLKAKTAAANRPRKAKEATS